MKPNRDSVSNRLRTIKENSGLSIAELALKVDSTKSKINSYLRGVALPPNDTVEKLALLANVKPEWIYYGELQDSIMDYLELIGHKTIIEFYPNFTKELENEYRREVNFNPNIPNENLLKQIFKKKYKKIFDEYLNENLNNNGYKEIIDQYVLPECEDLEDNWINFKKEVEFSVNRLLPNTWYVDEKKYFKVIDEVVEKYKMWATTVNPNRMRIPYEVTSKKNNFAEYLAEELKTSIGAANFINSVAGTFYLDYDFESVYSAEIIDAFQELGIKIGEIIKQNKSK